MPPNATTFIQRWLVNTLAVAAAANIVPGIGYTDWVNLVLASLLLGILNAFLRPILLLLTLPLLLVTLGLFTLVINALLLLLVGWLLPGFNLTGFGAAFWGALVVSLVSMALNALIGKNEKREANSDRRSKARRPPRDGGGPVIDV